MLLFTRDKIMPFKNLPLKFLFPAASTVLRLTLNCNAKRFFVVTILN